MDAHYALFEAIAKMLYRNMKGPDTNLFKEIIAFFLFDMACAFPNNVGLIAIFFLHKGTVFNFRIWARLEEIIHTCG